MRRVCAAGKWCFMNTELVVFIVYLCFMVGIGIYFFVKGRGSGEKEYSSAAVRWVPGFPLFLPALPT